MIKPTQVRAARMLLGWQQQELAAAAGISLNVVSSFERERIDPRRSSMERMEQALSKAGVLFLEADPTAGLGEGVRLLVGT